MVTKINPKQISPSHSALSSITAADADTLMISDTDAGELKKITLSALATYINAESSANVSADYVTASIGMSITGSVFFKGADLGGESEQAPAAGTPHSPGGFYFTGGSKLVFNGSLSGASVTGSQMHGVIQDSNDNQGKLLIHNKQSLRTIEIGVVAADGQEYIAFNEPSVQITKDKINFNGGMKVTASHGMLLNNQDGGAGHGLRLGSTSAIYGSLSNNHVNVDAGGDIILDAGATSQIIFKENETAFLQVSASSGHAIIANEAEDKDIIFMANPAGANTAQVARIDASAQSFLIQSGKELQFADEAEHISSDGSTLSIVSEDGSIAVGTSLADAQTISIGPAAATQLVLSPHGTAGSEKISLVNKSGTADDAIKIDAESGGLTLAAGNDSLILDADGTDADAINIDSAGGIDIDATTAINIATSDAAGDITLASAHTAGVAIHLDGDAAAGSIVDIDAGILDVDVTGVASIDSGGTLSLGTANSGVAVSIGHTTSEVTVNDNLTVTGDITVNGATTAISSDTVTFSSANTTDPLVVIKNTTNDTNAARLRLNKDKGAAAADGDDVGVVEFVGDNAVQTQTTFAKILSEVNTAAHKADSGKLSLQVRMNGGGDGGGAALANGLVLTGDADDLYVDVTLGHGTASTTTIAGNLTVNGTTTTVTSTTVNIDDPIFTLAGGATGSAQAADDNKDRGIEFHYNDGSAKRGFMGYDDSTGKFAFLTGATNSSEVFSGTPAAIVVGDVFVHTSNNGISEVNNHIIDGEGARLLSPALFNSGSGLHDEAQMLFKQRSADGGAVRSTTLEDLKDFVLIPVRDVFFSGAIGNVAAATDGANGDGTQATDGPQSGSMSLDLLTASLSQVAHRADGVQVFLNGLLLAPSGSLATGDNTGSFDGPSSDFDYRLSTGQEPDSNDVGVTGGEISSTANGNNVRHILLKTALDSDDILTVHYMKK